MGQAHTPGLKALTKAQREWLERISKENWALVDIASGGTSQLFSRLTRLGLIKYNAMDDWRDAFYSITDAGRTALSAARATGGTE